MTTPTPRPNLRHVPLDPWESTMIEVPIQPAPKARLSKKEILIGFAISLPVWAVLLWWAFR
jgi:hypothetical protein